MDGMISKFLNKNVNWHVHDVEIRYGDKLLHASASGILTTAADGSLTLEVCAEPVDGDLSTKALPRPMLFSGIAGPFSLPFKGISMGGFQGYCMPKGYKDWQLHVNSIEFSNDDDIFVAANKKQGDSRVISYLGKLPHYAFTNKYKNGAILDEFFGDTRISYQLMNVSEGTTQFALRMVESRAEASLLTPTDDLQKLDQLQKALLFALSLRYGYSIDCLATHKSTYQNDLVELIPDAQFTPDGEACSYPPISIGTFPDGTNEKFLCKAIAYYLTEERVQIEDYMIAFWEAGLARSLHVRESILGSIIEGLASEITGEQCAKDESFSDLKRLLLEVLKEEEANYPHVVDQFRSIVSNAKAVHVKEIIKAAAASLGFKVLDVEIQAWGRMRNAAAHGTHIRKDIGQQRSNDFYTCISLLNKFMMALIGYEGNFYDYSKLLSNSDTMSSFELDLRNKT